MANTDLVSQLLAQGAGGGSSILNALSGVGYKNAEDPASLAAAGVGSALPALVNPYASTGSNLISSIGGGLLASLLAGLGQRDTEANNAALIPLEGQYLSGTAEDRANLLSQEPRLQGLEPTRLAQELEAKKQEQSLQDSMALEHARSQDALANSIAHDTNPDVLAARIKEQTAMTEARHDAAPLDAKTQDKISQIIASLQNIEDVKNLIPKATTVTLGADPNSTIGSLLDSTLGAGVRAAKGEFSNTTEAQIAQRILDISEASTKALTGSSRGNMVAPRIQQLKVSGLGDLASKPEILSGLQASLAHELQAAIAANGAPAAAALQRESDARGFDYSKYLVPGLSTINSATGVDLGSAAAPSGIPAGWTPTSHTVGGKPVYLDPSGQPHVYQ